MRTMRLTMAVAVIALFTTTTAAFAAGKPVVTTGGHTKVTQTSVTLNGTINPNALLTSYFFQYGTSTAYGTQTGPVSIGQGTAAKAVATAVIGLKPNTGYHYRLVAINNAGTTLGKDASFTTPKQPLGLSLLATVNPAPFGGATVINATLTGSDNSGRKIVLEQRPFPYTAPYAPVGNVQLTSSTGLATFPILGLLINTQYVATIQGTNTSSLPLTVGSAVKVSLLGPVAACTRAAWRGSRAPSARSRMARSTPSRTCAARSGSTSPAGR